MATKKTKTKTINLMGDSQREQWHTVVKTKLERRKLQ